MPKKIKVVTQNCILGLRNPKVVRFMKKQMADVYCLQEITGVRACERIKKQTKYPYLLSNGNRAFLHFHQHNAIFTHLPILENGEIVEYRKEFDGSNYYVGRALWVTVNTNGKSVRIYNCYFNISRCGMKDRDLAIRSIFKHSIKFDGPIIICGDMNTCIPSKKLHRKLIKWFHKVPLPEPFEFGKYALMNEKYHFAKIAKEHGFTEVADLEHNTWTFPLPRIKLKIPDYKLDWFLIKNFKSYTCQLGPYIGDHKSIISELTL